MKARAVSVFSDRGARPAQEDHAAANREKGLFVVADGFGGPAPGANAATTACDEVQRFLSKEAGDLEATLPFVLRSYISLAGNVLFNALVHANRKVLRLNKGKPVHEKGGASVLAAFLDGDLLALANVGACTAWLLREGKAVELVTPRTYGRLHDPFEGGTESEHQIPLTALGISEDMEPEIFEYRVHAGDWLLLQSDGITERQRRALQGIQFNKFSQSEALTQAKQILEHPESEDNMAAILVFL